MVNEEIGEFIRNYTCNTYKKDYSHIFGLSFKRCIRNELRVRDYLNNFFKRLSDKGFVDGIFVCEKDMNGCYHLHGLLLTNIKNEELDVLFKRFWGSKIGVYLLENYEILGGYSYYMGKDYFKKGFDFDIIKNVIY